MDIRTRTATIYTAASATQALPVNAVQVKSAVLQKGGTTAVEIVDYTITTAAPAAATDLQFTGTTLNPSTTLTFDAALVADGILTVEYVAPGDFPASV